MGVGTETEVSYSIGGESYTEKEWDKLLQKFDDIQEDVRRKMEERFRKMEEKEEDCGRLGRAIR